MAAEGGHLFCELFLQGRGGGGHGPLGPAGSATGALDELIKLDELIMKETQVRAHPGNMKSPMVIKLQYQS